jgi:hypothetical protein
MQNLQGLQINKDLSMEIQVKTGIFPSRKGLVFNVDIQNNSGSETINSFVATLYEETTEGTPSYKDALFCSRGEGIEDWETTLTFVDFLLEINKLPPVDLEMAGWFYDLQISHIGGSAGIHYEVSTQITHCKNYGEPEYRLLPTNQITT